MNIRCPACQTVFRVDPARIPPAGVRARCSRCSAAFLITAQGAAPAPATAPAPTAAVAAPIPAATPPAPPATTPAPGAAPGPGGAEAAAQTRAGEPSAPVAGGTESDARPSVFGTRDPQARAQRIARALVSDIVAYHPRKRDEALANGTLRTEFRDEIMKSWEEYVAQVGSELAKATPYFRTALNEILARGQRVF